MSIIMLVWPHLRLWRSVLWNKALSGWSLSGGLVVLFRVEGLESVVSLELRVGTLRWWKNMYLCKLKNNRNGLCAQ